MDMGYSQLVAIRRNRAHVGLGSYIGPGIVSGLWIDQTDRQGVENRYKFMLTVAYDPLTKHGIRQEPKKGCGCFFGINSALSKSSLSSRFNPYRVTGASARDFATW
jgi:hypothetical protein